MLASHDLDIRGAGNLLGEEQSGHIREVGFELYQAMLEDLDLRMGLYRRLGDLEDKRAIEEFAAELIDRFGDIPDETQNLLKIVETKLNCKKAMIAKLDIGARGAVVTFAPGGFPDLQGLLGYIERLKGSAKLRPDSKLSVARDWPGPRTGSTALCRCRSGSPGSRPPASARRSRPESRFARPRNWAYARTVSSCRSKS
jgi:transcription-repair coupling factor (superfamily II helicase)